MALFAHAGGRPMQKIIQDLFTAKSLSVALVIEVGFIIGLFAGGNEMNPFQWGGAAMAMIGAVLFAALVFTWPKPALVNGRAADNG